MECLIAELAERQYGVVTRGQLLDAGVSRYAVDRRTARRQLRPIHRGVYAAGHPTLTPEGRWMAAVLAAGPQAVLSHRAAAALWSLRRGMYVEVTVRGRCRPPGFVTHRCRLPQDEVTLLHGIPVTTVPRTLLDLAAVLRPAQFERAVNEAEIRGCADPLSLADLVERYPRRRGTPAARSVLEQLKRGALATRSELEARFLELTSAAGLPRPETNAWLRVRGAWIECDCVWRDRRLVVELDGRAIHRTTAAFERDRARDRALHADGWRVVRITWSQLQDDSEEILADLRRILSSSPPP